MMYIEHLVLLAGAYNLGFFLFYNFLFFKTVVNMYKRETNFYVYRNEKQNFLYVYKNAKQ